MRLRSVHSGPTRSSSFLSRSAHAVTLCGACAALALAGCASNSALPPPVPDRTVQIAGVAGRLTMNSNSDASVSTIAAPIEQVWRVLPAVFDSLGVAISTVNQAQHLIGNDAQKVRQRLGKAPLSRYFDCGQTQIGPNADSYDVLLTLLIQLQPNGAGSTNLLSTIEATAKPVAFSQAPSACSSKGTLESRLTTLVQTLLPR